MCVKVFLIALVSLLSTVCFQMFSQHVCPRECIIALVAFVCLFSAVYFQVSPQSICTEGCITTMGAFIRFFPAVCFQMSRQTACLWEYRITLIALVRLFHRAFHAFIIHAYIFISKSLFHCQTNSFVVLCLIVASNWGKFKILKVFWIQRKPIESESDNNLVRKVSHAFLEISENFIEWKHLLLHLRG